MDSRREERSQAEPVGDVVRGILIRLANAPGLSEDEMRRRIEMLGERFT